MKAETKRNWQALFVWTVLMAGTFFVHGFPSLWWFLGCALVYLIVGGLLVLMWENIFSNPRETLFITAAIIVLLAVLVGLYYSRQWINAFLSGAAGIWVPVVAGALWVSLVAYVPHLQLERKSWKAVDAILEVGGILLFFLGIMLAVSYEGESRSPGSPPQTALVIGLWLSVFLGAKHIDECKKESQSRARKGFSKSQTRCYLAAAGAACLVIIAALAGLPNCYYILLRLGVSVAAGIGIYLFYRAFHALWLLGHIVVVLLFNPIHEISMSRSGWIVVDALSIIFFVVASLEVIRTRPEEPDAAPHRVGISSYMQKNRRRGSDGLG